MFLRSLTLKGFKSFADTTTLDFEPGVTVVVGPNGSGKSNVVDAVAWVLGAQAPTAVRSAKMDDVIFAGTDKRLALGRAEVSLTIDNTSGALPVDFTEVTITRTLFRTGDSEYALNGTPCRLLDIQELLSDGGVGRQQHVIISQGQIDGVLNARPEDRRSIIEEAAGVLKFRKRKEKSERRLRNTEASLTRIQDLLREVRRQLRPLERQAEAARRHGALVHELLQLQIATAGAELKQLSSRRADMASKRNELVQQSRNTKSELARLDTAVIGAEAQLAAHGGDDLGDMLVRFESLSERARGLRALLDERRRAVEVERSAFVDQAVVAAIEADVERLRADLAEADEEVAVLAPGVEALAESEAELQLRRAAFGERWGDGVPAPDGAAAELRGERAALASEHERVEREQELLGTRIADLQRRDAEFADQRRRIQQQLADIEATETSHVVEVDAAVQARDNRRAAHGRAVEAAGECRNSLHAAEARVEALDLALGEAHRRAGLDRLDDDGVLGSLVDLVGIDEGWERAFDAAAGEALTAVVVDGPESARRTIEAMRAEDFAASVLAPRHLPPTEVPAFGESVRRHVRSVPPSPGVDAILDTLLVGAVVVHGGVDRAIDAALAQPEALILTLDGDRFSPSGWRLAAGKGGATQAALDAARAEADRLAADLDRAEAEVTQTSHALDSAVQRLATAEAALEEVDHKTSEATQQLLRLDNGRQHLDVEREGLLAQVEELTLRSESIREKVLAIDARLPALEEDERARITEASEMTTARDDLERFAAEVGGRRTELDVAVAGIEQRRALLRSRLEESETKLAAHEDQRAELEARRAELDRRGVLLDELIARLEPRLERIDSTLDQYRQRRQRQSEEAREIAAGLDELRTKRQEAETTLRELGERAHRAEVEESEINVRIETATERIRSELDCDPRSAMEAEFPADLENPAERLRELERELKIMGPINPLALEEFGELQERHEFLTEQLDDIRQTRRELNKVIRSIDDEIVSVFSAAFADVSSNFEHLFATLFPGGKGGVKLTDPANPLTTGIEIEAKPSGKNVKKLSLLSGGERSLTALAFLFAVFRSRPSPFYVMDEVEAALDDVNLHRFLELVAEFRDDAQLLIVSHQKRTMESADVLYGVTMQSGGSSKVVSEQVGGPVPPRSAERIEAHA